MCIVLICCTSIARVYIYKPIRNNNWHLKASNNNMITGDMDGGGMLPASPTVSGDLDISECLKGIMGCMPPPFLIKTYNIVDDPKTNSIISWSSSGTSFIIWDHLKFSAEILPLYFKHNILSSFVSQLNNYVRITFEYWHSIFVQKFMLQLVNHFLMCRVSGKLEWIINGSTRTGIFKLGMNICSQTLKGGTKFPRK